MNNASGVGNSLELSAESLESSQTVSAVVSFSTGIIFWVNQPQSHRALEHPSPEVDVSIRLVTTQNYHCFLRCHAGWSFVVASLVITVLGLLWALDERMCQIVGLYLAHICGDTFWLTAYYTSNSSLLS